MFVLGAKILFLAAKYCILLNGIFKMLSSMKMHIRSAFLLTSCLAIRIDLHLKTCKAIWFSHGLRVCARAPENVFGERTEGELGGGTFLQLFLNYWIPTLRSHGHSFFEMDRKRR